MAWYDRIKLRPKYYDDEPEQTAAEQVTGAELLSAEYSGESVRASRRGQSWLALAVLVLCALLFAAIVVLAGRWAYHHWHKVYVTPNSKSDLPQPPPTNLVPPSD